MSHPLKGFFGDHKTFRAMHFDAGKVRMEGARWP